MCLSATEAEAEAETVSAVERCGKINSSAQTQNLKAMPLADVVVRWWLLNCGSSYARDDIGARWGMDPPTALPLSGSFLLLWLVMRVLSFLVIPPIHFFGFGERMAWVVVIKSFVIVL